jgi:hypothetical protein
VNESGVIRPWEPEKEQFHVRLVSGEEIRVRPKNLEVI